MAVLKVGFVKFYIIHSYKYTLFTCWVVKIIKNCVSYKAINQLCVVFTFAAVRILATKLVEQWLKIVKSESVVEVASFPIVSDTSDLQLASVPVPDNKDVEIPLADTSASHSISEVLIPTTSPSQSTHSMVFVDSLTSDEIDSHADETSAAMDPLDVSQQESTHNESDASNVPAKPKGLVYKITVKDGKQTLAKVDSSAVQMNSTPLGLKPVAKRKLSDDHLSVSDVKIKKQHSDDANDSESSSSKTSLGDSVKKDHKSVGEELLVSTKDSGRSGEKSKSSRERERGDRERERSKDHKSSSSRSGSSSSSLKPKSSSSSASKSQSSSSRSSRDEKDRHRSSSTKSSSSSRDKSREKSSSSKSESTANQASKDKETLSMIMPQSTLKLGKIPKKQNSDAEKSDTVAAGTATVSSPTGKKPSISIEVRKDFENRPKTVKTFNSKFRSHGLAEEAPPPPSRKGLKKPQSTVSAPGTTIPPSNPNTSKRQSTSPTPEMEKKPKLDVTVASNHVDKPGSIKLISPKPKRKYPRTWSPLLTHFCPFIQTGFVLLLLTTVLCVHYGRLPSNDDRPHAANSTPEMRQQRPVVPVVTLQASGYFMFNILLDILYQHFRHQLGCVVTY